MTNNCFRDDSRSTAFSNSLNYAKNVILGESMSKTFSLLTEIRIVLL